MTKILFRQTPKSAGAVIALSLGLALAGCGTLPTNRTLESIHQPVVERTNYTLDVNTGKGGLSLPEQRRVAGWFEAMDLKYGDRISVDDPASSEATRKAIQALASRYGLLINDQAPLTPGYVNAGMARIVISRTTAHVPGCPNWSTKSDFNPNNAASSNYGCATNGNIAAMVANPEHLIKGEKGLSDTTTMVSTKAINSYRDAK